MLRRQQFWNTVDELTALVNEGKMDMDARRGGCPTNRQAIDMMLLLSRKAGVDMLAHITKRPNEGYLIDGLMWRHRVLIPELYTLLAPWLTQADDLAFRDGKFCTFFGN